MDARFKALSNETRREILLLLAEGPMEAGKNYRKDSPLHLHPYLITCRS